MYSTVCAAHRYIICIVYLNLYLVWEEAPCEPGLPLAPRLLQLMSDIVVMISRLELTLYSEPQLLCIASNPQQQLMSIQALPQDSHTVSDTHTQPRGLSARCSTHSHLSFQFVSLELRVMSVCGPWGCKEKRYCEELVSLFYLPTAGTLIRRSF